MTNLELLDLMNKVRLLDKKERQIMRYYLSGPNEVLVPTRPDTHYVKAYSMGWLKDSLNSIDKETNPIDKQREEIKNRCPHPVGIIYENNIYCPICEKKLNKDCEFIQYCQKRLREEGKNTIFVDAGTHLPILGHIKERLLEILPLIPEVTPEGLADMIESEIFKYNRKAGIYVLSNDKLIKLIKGGITFREHFRSAQIAFVSSGDSIDYEKVQAIRAYVQRECEHPIAVNAKDYDYNHCLICGAPLNSSLDIPVVYTPALYLISYILGRLIELLSDSSITLEDAIDRIQEEINIANDCDFGKINR